MLNPASSDQRQGRPDSGPQGLPIATAESLGQTASARRVATARPTDQPEDVAREAVPAHAKPYRLVPTDPGDALY